MPPKIPSNCPNCSEQTIQLFDSEKIVHRYNLKEECPDNSGRRIPVGLAGGDEPGIVIDEVDDFNEMLDKLHKSLAKIREGEKGDDKRDADDAEADDECSFEHEPSDEADGEDDEETDEADETDAGENEEYEADDDDSKPMKQSKGNKGKSRASSGQPKPSESDNKQNMNPPPPSGANPDEWAIPAAKDINTLWDERVRIRGYKPTDEELAQVMLNHSKGKVRYTPLAVEETKKKEEPLKGIVVEPTLASKTQDALLAVYDMIAYLERYGIASNPDVQIKRQIAKFMSGMIVCEKCGTTDRSKWCGNDHPDKHRWRAKFMVPDVKPEDRSRIFFRDQEGVQSTTEFCAHCSRPVTAELRHVNSLDTTCDGRSIIAGGRPPAGLTPGEPYYYRPWAADADAYSPISTPCPDCKEQRYKPYGSDLSFHFSTGNATCKRKRILY